MFGIRLLSALLYFATILGLQAQQDSIYHYHRAQIIKPKTPTDLINATQYFEQQTTAHLERGDSLSAVSDLRLIAMGQNALGMYQAGERSVVRAIELLKYQQDSPEVREAYTGLYNQLGLFYRSQEYFDKSLDYYQRALQMAPKRSDSLRILANISLNQIDQADYELAESSLKLHLEILEQDAYGTASYNRVLSNLGHAQGKLNRKGALEKLQQSLNLRRLEGDSKGEYSSLQHLTVYYRDRGQTAMAIAYADTAVSVAETINSGSFMEDAYKQRLLAMGDSATIRFVAINDSLKTVDRRAQNRFAAMQFDYQEERQKAAQNALETEKQKQAKLLFALISVLIALLSLTIIALLRIRHKRRQQLQIYKTETRISKKVHDEVANDVYRLMARMQTDNITPDALMDELDNIYGKTRDISREIGSLDLQSNYSAALKELLLAYENQEVAVILQHWEEVDWNTLNLGKRITLYRVLQELMTNMKKHSKASLVVVGVSQEGRKWTVQYSDNGIGTELGPKRGLQNTETRMASIDGSISFESEPNKGFKAKLNL